MDKVQNARRDPSSGAVVFTDAKAYERAKIRRSRAEAITNQSNEVVSLRGDVARLSALVERLLQGQTI